MSETEGAERRLIRMLDECGRVLRDAVARVCRGPLGLHRDEIEQEARIRLWRACRRETAITDLRLYLHRVVATAAIDAMRQVRSRREIPLEAPAIERADRASPERVAAAREQVEAARQALARLPANRRRAVGLHLQGFTNEEIAGLLGWTEPKARNLVYRGLAELREKLRQDAPVRLDEPRMIDGKR